jgi:hypothetical protein
MHVTKFGVVVHSRRTIVDQYVALDVSLQKTAVCVLNVSGRVFIEADVPSEPAALIAFIQTHAPRAARVGLERQTPRPAPSTPISKIGFKPNQDPFSLSAISTFF